MVDAFHIANIFLTLGWLCATAEGLIVHALIGIVVISINYLIVASAHALSSSNWPHFYSTGHDYNKI